MGNKSRDPGRQQLYVYVQECVCVYAYSLAKYNNIDMKKYYKLKE